MKVIRRGKCSLCGNPARETREFIVTIDMFEPDTKKVISGPLKKELKAWRKAPLFCEKHEDDRRFLEGKHK